MVKVVAFHNNYTGDDTVNAFQSIKSRLLIFGLCMSLMPIAVITTIYYYTAKTPLKCHQLEELKAIAKLKEMYIQSFLTAKKGRAADFSSDGFIRDSIEGLNRGDSDRDTVLKALNSHLLLNKKSVDPQLVAVAIADPAGRLIASSDGAMMGKVISGCKVFQQIINKTRKESCIALSPCNPHFGSNLMFIYAPVFSQTDADLRGVIINVYTMESLNEITMEPVGMGKTGEVLLGQRKDDRVVILTPLRYAPNPSAPLSLPVNSVSARPMKLALAGESGTVMANDYRGVDVLVVYQYLPFMDAGMVVKIDRAEVFAPIKRLGIVALIIGVSSAIVVIVAGIVFALSIARPLKDLTNATKRFASGDLDFRIKEIRKDEFGVLSRGFNAMVDELARSNKELQDFAHVASHDLQEPLRKIVAFGDRLYTTNASVFSEQGKDYLERMQNAAKRMQSFIDDLLQYSRITTKARPFEPVNVEAIIREVLVDLEEHVKRTKGKIVVEKLPIIDADKMQMRQLFQNLIANALKFHKKEEPPVIIIKSNCVDSACCKIMVEDKGIGFDEKYLDRIFKPFERLHGRSEYEGTGMGLAICKKIVQRHNGEITAKSSPGKGATFTIRLPFYQGNGGIK